MAQMKDLSMTLRVSDAMLTDVLTLPWRATLDEAVEMLLRTSQHEFPVLNDAGRVLGVLTRDDMIAALKRHGPATPVTDIMHRNLPAVGAHDRFDEAYRLMQAHDSPVLPVVDRHGRLLGLVTTENVGETMLMHSLRPRDAEQAWQGMRVAL